MHRWQSRRRLPTRAKYFTRGAMLAQALPQMVPKPEVEFRASLGTVVSKSVELKNPSSKPITYEVTLEGSTDFRVKTNKVIYFYGPRVTKYLITSHGFVANHGAFVEGSRLNTGVLSAIASILTESETERLC